MQKILTLFLASLLTATAIAQTLQNPWADAHEENLAAIDSRRRTPLPTKYRPLSLDLDLLKSNLKDAPMRYTPAGEDSKVTLSIPMPDGSMQDFQVVEAPVMHPDLAAKYPYIRLFAGWSRKDRTVSLRCGYTQKGFHAMVLSAEHNTVFIDALAEGDDQHYISYFKKDYPNDGNFECLTKSDAQEEPLSSEMLKSDLSQDCRRQNFCTTGS